MNTNVFDSEGDPPAYDLVFSRKPRIYPFSEDSKTVLREEDMFVEISEMDDDAVEITKEQTKSVNEVTQKRFYILESFPPKLR